jgi:starch synthase
MFTPAVDGSPALERLLRDLGPDGLFILLGSGDPAYEAELLRLAARAPNLLFLCGYSERLGAALYESGDLFLMPSSFEPCGISQMLAMRSGQPCVVHGVGGLRDTVADERTGFVFNGDTPADQSRQFVRRVAEALAVRRENPSRWDSIRRAAGDQRFDWGRAARTYIRDMYAKE